jgi:uncharacterized protein YegP (UPF0339 family)
MTSNQAKQQYCHEMKEQLEGLVFDQKVALTFHLYKPSKRKIDRSNILCIVEKFFCDALVHYKCIEDDNDQFIESTKYITAGIDIVDDCRMYAKNPSKWCDRYLNQCSPKEDNMAGMTKQRPKIIFEFYKGKGKHPYRWRARSCNGKIICSGEGMINKGAPKKTVSNMIEAIKLNQVDCRDV